MNQTTLGLPLLLALAIPVLPGCTKSPPPAKNPAAKPSASREDLLKPALDLLRQATDVVHYRDALHLLNSHLSKDTARPVTPFTSEENEALQKLCRLNTEEMAEVSANVFRPLDYYHLQSSYLFRDAGRLLEIAKVPPLEQAQHCFHWVMRRIQLHEQADEWLPPAFVLRRGFGGGRDRALVFLALLRQFQIEGCLLAPPGQTGEVSTPILAGVLLMQQQPALFLFDPRLGQAVAGPKGTGIATLGDVRAQPELLKPSAIPAELVPKLEVYQVSPLEALSARMRYLQDLLAFQDRITLFQDAAAVSRELAKVAGRDAQFWNSPAPAKGPSPPSPLRALRLFLPPEVGGIDQLGRLKGFQFEQIPWPGIMQQLQVMRVYQEIPELARKPLIHNITELFNAFYLQPEELFLRGHYDAMLNRVRRIRTVLETEEAANPLEEAALQKLLDDWRERVREAYLALVARKDPAGQAKVNAIWGEDQYLLNLLDMNSDIPLQKFEKKILSLILFSACREPLGQQVSYLVASCLHEKAAQLQANQEFLAAAGKDVTIVKGNATYAWKNARGAWNKFLERYKVNPSDKSNPRDPPQRLAEIQQRWSRNDPASAVNLLEQLHLDMHATFEARLRLAEVQQIQSGQASGPALKDLLADLDAFQKSDLSRDLSQYLEKARAAPQLAQRLELLARDWAPQGNLYWLREAVRQRLQKAK